MNFINKWNPTCIVNSLNEILSFNKLLFINLKKIILDLVPKVVKKLYL